ncbi:MAG: Hsp20/alpha crystallin family protein [Gammaproteobacteria bacterium]|nr:Hsp20/alpha crystallin family protein [Gammaproteobacteria bacterium]
MNITRHDPFSMLSDEVSRNLLSRFSQLAGDPEESGLAAEWAPAVDISEEEDKYVVSADIPGVDPKDIEVTVDNNVLTISGKRESEKREEQEGYCRVERSSGRFFRRFVLPETVDDSRVSAKSGKGVLNITIPKSEKQKAKRIKVSD